MGVRQDHEPPAFYIHQSGDTPTGTMCGHVSDPRAHKVPGSPTVTCWLCKAICYQVVTKEAARDFVRKEMAGHGR